MQLYKRLTQVIQDYSENLLMGGFILILMLCLTVVLILFDFLPKLIGIPENFPIKGTCQITNITFLDHYCLEKFEPPEGGIYSQWTPCFIAKLDVSYKLDEPDLIESELMNSGECIFLYPESTSSRPSLSKTISADFELDRYYPCWINNKGSYCFLVDQSSDLVVFIISESVLFLIICCITVFIIYVYRKSQQLSFF